MRRIASLLNMWNRSFLSTFLYRTFTDYHLPVCAGARQSGFKSIPLGKFCRISPSLLSFRPRSQELYGWSRYPCGASTSALPQPSPPRHACCVYTQPTHSAISSLPGQPAHLSVSWLHTVKKLNIAISRPISNLLTQHEVFIVELTRSKGFWHFTNTV